MSLYAILPVDMNIPEPTTHQAKLHQLADHLQAASELLRQLAQDQILPLADDQAWYWSDQWQAMETDADAAKQRGEYTDFSSVGDALDFLHRQV